MPHIFNTTKTVKLDHSLKLTSFLHRFLVRGLDFLLAIIVHLEVLVYGSTAIEYRWSHAHETTTRHKKTRKRTQKTISDLNKIRREWSGHVE